MSLKTVRCVVKNKEQEICQVFVCPTSDVVTAAAAILVVVLLLLFLLRLLMC